MWGENPRERDGMEQISEYPGPSLDDYANVLALNTAFIRVAFELKSPQRGRLAAAPFLLFSFRERDAEWWQDALVERRQADLLAIPELDNPELQRIQTAAISFLWQLARRNPYAARIISGATVAWCETITELPLVTLLDRIAARGDLMQSRLDNPALFGERLLGNGTSSRRKVRTSSQMTALQSLLTRPRSDNHTRLPAAACRMATPMRVRDKKM